MEGETGERSARLFAPYRTMARIRAFENLLTSHRGHGHTLAKGADMAKMLCELYRRATGPTVRAFLRR